MLRMSPKRIRAPKSSSLLEGTFRRRLAVVLNLFRILRADGGGGGLVGSRP